MPAKHYVQVKFQTRVIDKDFYRISVLVISRSLVKRKRFLHNKYPALGLLTIQNRASVRERTQVSLNDDYEMVRSLRWILLLSTHLYIATWNLCKQAMQNNASLSVFHHCILTLNQGTSFATKRSTNINLCNFETGNTILRLPKLELIIKMRTWVESIITEMTLYFYYCYIAAQYSSLLVYNTCFNK